MRTRLLFGCPFPRYITTYSTSFKWKGNYCSLSYIYTSEMSPLPLYCRCSRSPTARITTHGRERSARLCARTLCPLSAVCTRATQGSQKSTFYSIWSCAWSSSDPHLHSIQRGKCDTERQRLYKPSLILSANPSDYSASKDYHLSL